MSILYLGRVGCLFLCRGEVNMAEEFKRLDRKLVYHGTIIDYYRDTIQVPNGNIAEWDFIGHKGAAAVVPVREDGKLLMVRQWRNALDRYTLEIPAGGLNGDAGCRARAGRGDGISF